jgi:glutathione S-transferase
MTSKRNLVHATFLFLLPLAVAWFDLTVWSAIWLVLVMLLWRWIISLSIFVMPAKVPVLVLDTISASHFVEKVRWNMDRAGIEYTEKAAGGTLGAFFMGRTVPRLKIKTGATRSQIGNSPEILRYLWGAYSGTTEVDVDHLAPTAERLDFEKRLDRYGVNLQVWIYFHILDDRELTLRLWGASSPAVPAWQRSTLQILYPLQAYLIRKSFRTTPENADKAREHIEALLAEMDTALADGRESILGEGEVNFTDITFAAMTGLWLQPPEYGGGRADDVMVSRDKLPDAMRADIERWTEDYPRAVAWVQRLYAEER